MSEMDEAIQEFLIESDENLSQVEQDLLELETHPDGSDILANIFRAVHTVKGTCSFLGYSKLESLAHTGETLLSLLRDGDITLTPAIASALLKMVDAIRQMLTCIQETTVDGEEEYGELKALLTELQKGDVAPSSQSDAASSDQVSEAPVDADQTTAEGEQVVNEEPSADEVALSVSPTAVAPVEHASNAAVVEEKKEKAAPSGDGKSQSAVDANIRVDVGLLDKLMNMVGELVLTRNQILQSPMILDDAALQTSSQRLSLITSELQEGIMKTRMQPIGNIFGKFPRVVRDLSMNCGKQIRVEMEGKETELDKTLIEAIKDPLTHLVRNSVDHGIETPDVRQSNGKSSEGILLLRAYHEGGQVNIEITDDGGGINTQRVAETGVKRGVVTQDQIAKMSERELLNLIFMPGFSTAEKVTNVSGRGVGMDVVRTNIEKIGGTIDIQAHLGKGTTFKLKVPLTLAIIPALIITTGHERFAIPQVSLLELVRLEGEQIKKFIDTVHGASVCRLRGTLLPLLHLGQIVGLDVKESGSKNPETMESPADASDAEAVENVVNIVVLQADGQRFGLVVDEINDTEEIVVKPLSKQLKGVPVFAGATIMGDGRVALILDVLGLTNRAGMTIQHTENSRIDQLEKGFDGIGSRDTLLIVKVGETGQLAIPLTMVARLEEIKMAALEKACGKEVIQYRGEILPIIQLCDVLSYQGTPDADSGDALQMVVISHGQRRIGLVVDRIVDIVDEHLQAKQGSTKPGILCSAVIQGHVTDVLDVQQLILDYAVLPAEESVEAFIEDPVGEFVGV